MSTLASIPDCTVYHVFGETESKLAQGSLSLIDSSTIPVEAPPASHPVAASDGIASRPLLTLTVGASAFSLFPTTVFGTREGDSRIYLFTPEIGPGGGHGGFIRLELPDGVTVDGSELGNLQEQFERALIEKGLLESGEGEASLTKKVEEVVGKSSNTANPGSH